MLVTAFRNQPAQRDSFLLLGSGNSSYRCTLKWTEAYILWTGMKSIAFSFVRVGGGGGGGRGRGGRDVTNVLYSGGMAKHWVGSEDHNRVYVWRELQVLSYK